VLIVDDDRTVVRIVSTYLGRAGYRTHAAGDGFEALGVAAEQWPDLVVLDLTLPGLAGYDVMRRLKDRGQVFVILLSARGQPGDRVTGLRLGADDYVPKPFSPNELVARVDAVLRRAERPPATGEAVVHEGLEIDCDGRRVRVRGAEVALTAAGLEDLTLRRHRDRAGPHPATETQDRGGSVGAELGPHGVGRGIPLPGAGVKRIVHAPVTGS
jgi:DNA-binding response OmpR family regulator